MHISDIPLECVREALGLGPPEPGADACIPLDQWLGSITDREGRILQISPRFCASLGYRSEEAIGANHRMFSSRLHSHAFFQNLWETIRGGRQWSGAIVNRTRTGALRHYETTIRPIFSPEREIVGFVAMRLELNLGLSVIEQHPWLPSHVLDQVAEGVMIVDAQHPDEPVIYVNAAWCRITGYHPDEVLGRNPRFLQGAGTNVGAMSEMVVALREGKHFECEVINYRRNGVPFWNRLSVSPVFAPDGQVLHYTAIVCDASEQRAGRLMLNLEKNLLGEIVRERPLAELFHSLLGHLAEFIPFAGAAVQVVDPAGTTLRLATSQGLPAPVTELLAVAPWGNDEDTYRYFEAAGDVLLLPEDTGESEDAADEASRGFVHLRNAIKHAGWEMAWALPATGSDASVEAVLLLVFKERRGPCERELEFLKLAAHLLSVSIARGHSRRLRETIDRKIRQSQRMEAIGTLAGGIAHDFNNILGGLFGFLHLAAEDIGADHPAQEWLREIDGACKRARDLVHQVLTFSRTEGAARMPINLASVVKDATGLVRASLPSSVAIEFVRPGKVLPEILGDPTQIQLAVLNLCTNAWQAMERGSGRIELRLTTAVSEEGRGIVQLSVKDDGVGIAPDQVERIFDPFFSTRPVGSGTGLGLSVVHGIVKAHDGQVVVESVPNGGSTFHLQFPVAERVPEAPATVQSESPRGAGERVLFIDDELAIVTWSRLILERMGYVVEAFTDPEIALRHLRENLDNFDLVVTDLTMPGLSGSDVIRRVREWRPELPIILTSGRGMVLTPEELAGLGTAELLYKPIGMDDLCRALRRALERSLGPSGC